MTFHIQRNLRGHWSDLNFFIATQAEGIREAKSLAQRHGDNIRLVSRETRDQVIPLERETKKDERKSQGEPGQKRIGDATTNESDG